MTRWWRAYDDALHDPKVQSLPPILFKFWFNLLCVASKYGGRLPPSSELKAILKMRSNYLEDHIQALLKTGLLDEIDGHLEPHNWMKRQYKSDNSTPRVQAHRNAKGNVSVTPPEYRVQSTETEREDKVTSVTTKAPEVLVPQTPSPSVSAQIITLSAAQENTKSERSLLFRDAERLVGKDAGGVIGKLLKVNGDNLAHARRAISGAAEAVDAKRYFWKVIHEMEAFAKQEELDRKQVAEWRPIKPRFPERDYSHPRQPYFIVSKVDNKKRLYLDTNKVHELVYAKADEMGVVL